MYGLSFADSMIILGFFTLLIVLPMFGGSE